MARARFDARPDVVETRYDGHAMKVVFRGVFAEGSVGTGMTISRYFFDVDRYDPFTVNQKLAPRLATGFRDPATDKRWTEESLADWYRLFTFGRLRDSLELNRLLSRPLLLQVEVHHSSLSPYVHGVQKAYTQVYGSRRGPRMGAFDHYDSEICLLYVIALAAAELVAFGRMAKREPTLNLRDWSTVKREIVMARAASSHFWFLSGVPTMYDRIQEIETRFRLPGSKPSRRPKVMDPARLKPSNVRYYFNPRRRLIGLHGSYREYMTGIVYQSPFHRDDALQRRMD